MTRICRSDASVLCRADQPPCPAAFLEPDMSNSVPDAIAAIAAGEIVVVTDDDDREAEGDLVIAASMVTPEKMAFIIRNCCGIVCAPLTGITGAKATIGNARICLHIFAYQ